MHPAYLSPLVDIYMPTFEPDPLYLREAIESVLAQTEERWHLWIHDDASESDVRTIVEPFLTDPRITFQRSNQRLGIGGNWNACLPLSTAPFIQFLFQDDQWEAGYLGEALNVLQSQSAVGLVMTGHHYACDKTIRNEAMYRELEHLRQELPPGLHEGTVFLTAWLARGLHPNLIGEPSFVLLRRSVVEAVGPFDEDLPQCLDLAYWTRCLLSTHWWHLPESRGIFRVHKHAASQQNEQSGSGIYDRLLCFERLICLLPQGTLKQAAIHSRRVALEQMARKFLKRRKAGKGIPRSSPSSMKRFALRHPLLLVRALFRAMLTESTASASTHPVVSPLQ